MLSSYFVELRTGTDYTPEDYDAAAGRLVEVFVSLLADPANIDSLTHDTPRTSCTSEVEVSLEVNGEARELVAKAVVDIMADEAVKFDKARFTKLLKARPEADEWKKMKVNKRQVPAD
tara:strand:+ start:462 stop:815 length:354 start_codon:yes stop_codon:yes gene_type:complete